MYAVVNIADAVTFGPDQPERFLGAWLGEPNRSGANASVSRDLPPQLVRWHQQVARWGHSSVMRQNRVPTTPEMDGDVLLVGVETQAVWLWGIVDDTDNPPVVERENEPGSRWTPTGEHLDEFLWHFTLVESIFGARYGLAANVVTTDQLARFADPWTPIPAKQWRWPGPDQALWTMGQALAWTIGNDRPDALVTPETFRSIFVSATSNRDLAEIDNAGIAWDWDSREESDER